MRGVNTPVLIKVCKYELFFKKKIFFFLSFLKENQNKSLKMES